MTIASALAIYAEKHAPTVMAPRADRLCDPGITSDLGDLPSEASTAAFADDTPRAGTRLPERCARNWASPGCHQLRVFRGLSDRNTKAPSTREVRAEGPLSHPGRGRRACCGLHTGVPREASGAVHFDRDLHRHPVQRCPGPSLHAERSGWLGGYRTRRLVPPWNG